MTRTISASARFDAQPDAAFALLTDIASLPTWNDAITRVVDQPASLQPGAEWVVELRAMGQTWESRSHLRELDPTSGRFAYRSCTDDGNPSWAEWAWTVTGTAGGGSRVSVTLEVHPVTFWRRVLFVRIRARQLRRTELPRSLAALAAALQAAPT